MKKLIKVYCEEDQWIVCDCCDGATVVTKTYYRIEGAKDHYEMCRRYLDCCKDQVGAVVDWEEQYK